MTDSGVLGAQAQAMIGQLRRYESDQVGEILDRGHASAREVVKQAHAQARTSVHRAVERERQRRRQDELKTRARHETHTRLQIQLRVGQLLAMGWEQLPEVLVERWNNPQTRRRWWTSALEEAGQRLLESSLLVEHAAGLSTAELTEMRALCPGRELSFTEIEALPAGLRVRGAGASLDATIDSLLADQPRIESLLLAAYHETAAQGDTDA